MKKSSLLDYIVLGALFILLTVALLLVETQKTLGFWIAYGFTAVSFLSEFYMVNRSRGNAARVHTRLLGMPVLQLGMLYAAVQIIILAVFAVIPTLPFWLSIIVCTLSLLFFGFFILTADYPEEGEEESEYSLIMHGDRNKVFSLDIIYDEVKETSKNVSDDETNALLRTLCEKINLSSNIRSEETKAIEKKILSKVGALKSAPDKKILAQELISLIDKRNEICEKL